MSVKVTHFYKSENIEKWAQDNLDQIELSEFQGAQADHESRMQAFRDAGKYSFEFVYQTFHSNLLNQDVDLIVGDRVVFAPGSSFETDCAPTPEYQFWLERYWQATGGDILVFEDQQR